MAEAIRVKGLRELDRAFRNMDKDLSKKLRASLKEAAEIVAPVARSKFERIQPRSAATMTARARARGASVEQSQGRTTGLRPDFGSLQMRIALMPALDEKAPEVEQKVDEMLGHLAAENGF